MATMNATVTDIIARQGLLVTDSSTGQEVRVNYQNTDRFSVGDNVRITYDGRMTLSIPPQITASSIQIVSSGNRPGPGPGPGPQPGPGPGPGNRPSQPLNETRGVVVRRGTGFLIVRTLLNRQIRVNYRFANHFCPGQRIIIRHIMLLPILTQQINAIDIEPIC